MKIYIPEDRYQETYDSAVVPYLAAHKTADDFFESFDQAKIHYAVFGADNPKGTIVIPFSAQNSAGREEICGKIEEILSAKQ